jgi:thiosulfate/3-mercaptopyruvate sulfurtransferase
MMLFMLLTYQQTISCQQLYDLLLSTCSQISHTSENRQNDAISLSKSIILLDASIPPVGKMNQPDKQWPDHTLPSAQRFDLNKNFSDLSNPLPHSMPSAEHFQQQVQLLGIPENSQIVVYDNQGIFSAARAWYMFKSMGHNNIAVLDGGLPAWLAAGFPTLPSPSKAKVCNTFNANFTQQYFCSSDEVYKQTLSGEQLILDARASSRFEGRVAEPRAGIRSGHMPNSVNLPFSDLLNNGLLLPVDTLKEKFKKLNSQNKPMIMSCGSGVTACVLALVADICNFKKVKVYDGSWSEWGADLSLPIVTDK